MEQVIQKVFIRTPNKPFPDVIGDFMDKMKQVGIPPVHAYYSPEEDIYFAIEGSHRVACAKMLCMPLTIVKIGLHHNLGPHTVKEQLDGWGWNVKGPLYFFQKATVISRD